MEMGFRMVLRQTTRCAMCRQTYDSERTWPEHTRPRYLGSRKDRLADALDFFHCPSCWMPVDDETIARLRARRARRRKRRAA